MRHFLSPLLLSALLLSADQNAIVQPRAPAGIVERLIQEEYETKPVTPDKEIPFIEVDVPDEQLDFPDDESVYVDKITFRGNTRATDTELSALLQPYLGSHLFMKDILAICNSIEKYYLKKGYFLARAYPPPQDIDDDTLTIEVIEGVLGSVCVEGNQYYSSYFIEGYFTDMIDQPIEYNLLLKRILLLNDNNNLRAGLVFVKGEVPGTADLIVRVFDKRPVQLAFDYNNYGSSFTTRSRVGAKGNYGNFLTNGDNVWVTQVFGLPFSDLSFTQAVYRIPIYRRTGTQLEGAYLYSRFHVPPLKLLEVKGQTNIGTVRFLQALKRTRAFNADCSLSFDFKDIRNYTLGEATSIDILRMLGLNFTCDYVDHWANANGRTFFDSTLYFGIPDIFGASPSVNPRSSHPGAGSKFIKWIAGARRIQELPYNGFLMLNVQGQVTDGKVPIAEAIYIGGVDTVRGFLPAVALGDMGVFGNCELRIPIPCFGNYRVFRTQKRWKDILQLVGFIDSGTVFFLNNNSTTQLTLTGVGCGARLFGFWNFDASVDVGFPIQSDISPTPTITYFRLNWHLF